MRYHHYIKSYNEKVGLIKDFLNSDKTKKTSRADSKNFENQNLAFKPKTAKEIREKYKLSLLQYFETDTQKRKLEKQLTEESSKKGNKLAEKILKRKFEKEKKKNSQKERFFFIQKERDETNKDLDDKFNRSVRSAPDAKNNTFTK